MSSRFLFILPKITDTRTDARDSPLIENIKIIGNKMM